VEHLWALGREAFGEEADCWVENVKQKLWEGRREQVIPECEEVLGRRSGWSAEVARRAEYFRERRVQMESPAFRKAGYPIGLNPPTILGHTHKRGLTDRQYNLGPSGEILIGEEINGQGESDHVPERFPDGLMAGVVASECPPLCSRARVWDTVTVASRFMISSETVWTSVSMQFAVPFSRAIKNMDVGEQYVFGPWASLWR
jgi:hypothetical protein